MTGTCPTCGSEFHSKKRKTFCCHDCYVKSPQFKDMVNGFRTERVKLVCEHCKKEFHRTAGDLNNPHSSNKFCSRRCYHESGHPNSRKGPVVERVCLKCLQCGVEFQERRSEVARRGRKFCSVPCKRRYFSERFDRWVANPEEVPLPQNYDEFLTQEELPCLFADCEWVGRNLGIHVNHAHGISAADFKEMAGFNRGTALVSPSAHERMSEAQRKAGNEGEGCPLYGFPQPDVELGKYERRREQREHLKKVWALKRASRQS